MAQRKKKVPKGAKVIQKGPKVKRKLIVNKIKISEEQLFADFLTAYMRKGTTMQAVYEVIQQYDGRITYDDIRYHLDRLNKYLQEMTEQSFKELFFKHAFIYNKIWRFFKANGVAFGANKALLFKEKLFGFHDDQNQSLFEINNEVQLITGTDFDTNRLNEAEQVRLEELLLKCKPIKMLKKTA